MRKKKKDPAGGTRTGLPGDSAASRGGDGAALLAGRLETADLLRGLTLVSMILYHGMWDYLYLSGAGARADGLRAWYEGTGGHLWQQSICRTFLLLSGFCVPFSRHIFRRGFLVSADGIAVSAVTLLFLYEERILFGVLTFLGAAMLLTGLLRAAGLLRHAAHAAAAAACAYAFYVTRWIGQGYLRLLPGVRLPVPSALYGAGGGRAAGYLLTGLGFPMAGFFSTDYFPLLPWIFLFWTGMFLHEWAAALPRGDGARGDGGSFSHPLFHLQLPLLNRMGRHSLLIYLLHQPVLYLASLLLFS